MLIQQFINGEVLVSVPKQFIRHFLSICEDYDIRWNPGLEASSYYPYVPDIHRALFGYGIFKEGCISWGVIGESEATGSLRFGLPVVSYEEFLAGDDCNDEPEFPDLMSVILNGAE